MFRRLRTKVPSLVLPARGKIHREAQAMDRDTRTERKRVFDRRRKAQEKEIQPGDKVLIKQDKTTIDPPKICDLVHC